MQRMKRWRGKKKRGNFECPADALFSLSHDFNVLLFYLFIRALFTHSVFSFFFSPFFFLVDSFFCVRRFSWFSVRAETTPVVRRLCKSKFIFYATHFECHVRRAKDLLLNIFHSWAQTINVHVYQKCVMFMPRDNKKASQKREKKSLTKTLRRKHRFQFCFSLSQLRFAFEV